MTAAPTHAIARRIPVSLAILAALALGACRDTADGRPAGPAGPAGAGAQMEAAGPVVIPGPSGKYVGGPVAGGGTVSGIVSATSPLAPAAPTPAGRDSAVCGTSIPDSSVVQSGAGLGNVVVWLEGARRGKPMSLERRIELESDRCQLVPRVQAALTGGAVNVIGHDPFRQHLRFLAGGEKAPRATVLLGKDEQVIPSELPLRSPGLVIVRDADHAWPRAFVAVFDHPYFAVTKADGSFTLDQVPAGAYTLVAWHERTGRSEQQVQVGAGATVKVEVKLGAK